MKKEEEIMTWKSVFKNNYKMYERASYIQNNTYLSRALKNYQGLIHQMDKLTHNFQPVIQNQEPERTAINQNCRNI